MLREFVMRRARWMLVLIAVTLSVLNTACQHRGLCRDRCDDERNYCPVNP
jgi:hypothetical protein